MRYILIILVFLSVGAKAQMVIKAHPNYVPFAVAGGLLLDSFPNAAAAYSLRKLDKDYAGSAIRVRKDTTGQPEQDIGFTAAGDLDTASLKSFLNARSGFVVTWYDQSVNARNTTQSTQANQPRIANLGVIDRQNGKPALIYDGSNDFLGAATASDWEFLHYGNHYTNFTVARAGNVTDPEALYTLWGTTNTVTRRGAYLVHDTRSSALRDRALAHVIGNGGGVNEITCLNVQTAATTPANTQFLGYILGNPNTLTVANRSFLATNNNSTQNNNTNNGISAPNNPNHALRIGTAANASGTNLFFLLGSTQEIIFYSSDQSANRTGISNNINAFYSIY